MERNTLKSFLSMSLTAADTAKPFSEIDVPFYEGNFHIYTHPAYYGDGNVMSAYGIAGSVLTFPKGNLREIYFKNYNAGNNAVIVFVGTVPTNYTNELTKF